MNIILGPTIWDREPSQKVELHNRQGWREQHHKSRCRTSNLSR